MGKLEGPFIDEMSGERYYTTVLIAAGEKVNLSGRDYTINQSRLDDTTFFSQKRHNVELHHPMLTRGMSEQEVTDACYKPRPDAVKAKLRDINVNKQLDLVASVYPIYPEEFTRLVEDGFEIAMRALTNGTNQVVDVVAFDFVHNGRHVDIQTRLNAKTPPLNTTVMISSNVGNTWFPAQFLWIGKKSFVWRNMLPGAYKDNEIPERAHHSYFRWIPLGELEMRSHQTPNEPEHIRAYIISESEKQK